MYMKWTPDFRLVNYFEQLAVKSFSHTSCKDFVNFDKFGRSIEVNLIEFAVYTILSISQN
jgi:hypothetical protein